MRGLRRQAVARYWSLRPIVMVLLAAGTLTACSWPGSLIVHNAHATDTITIRLYSDERIQDRSMVRDEAGELLIAGAPADADPAGFGRESWQPAPESVLSVSENGNGDGMIVEIRVPPRSAINLMVKSCCDGYRGEGAWFNRMSVIQPGGEISLDASERHFLQIWKRIDRGRHYLRVADRVEYD